MDKAGWARSQPMEVLHLDEVRRLAGNHVVRATPIGGGLNSTMLALWSGGETPAAVLRIVRDDAVWQREVAVLQRVAPSVPVPRLMDADRASRALVLSWVEGVSLRDVRQQGTASEQEAAGQSVGQVLAAIGQFTFSTPGMFLDGLHPVPSPEFEWHAFLHRCLDRIPSQRLSPADCEALRHLGERAAPRLAAWPPQACLVHGDFNARNILMRPDQTVAAVLDWEFAWSGDPLNDVGNLVRYPRPHFESGFVAGYPYLPPDWRQLSRLLDVLALLDMLTRPHLPPQVVTELVDLALATATSYKV